MGHESIPVKHPEKRLQSGIPRLDDILKGGFLKGSVYSVLGPPGAGKTVFANQLCFSCAKKDDTPCLYISILVESVTKILSHIEDLEFFERRLVNSKILYHSGYGILKKDGYGGLLTMIRQTIREHRAQILVLDGVEETETSATAMRSFREFIHELQAVTSLFGCTTFLLTPSSNRNIVPQNNLVDGIMEFSRELIGPRAVHELTIHKFRGSGYLQGKHEVEISDEGLQIHPRTEIQFSKPPEQATEDRVRMGFGIKRFDEMLEGGLLSGSCTTLLGSPGTGKTNLGLHFLVEGARQGQKGLYFGFYEPPPRLIEKSAKLGLDLKTWVDQGLIELIWQPPLEHFLDSLAEQLLEKLRCDKNSKRRRLFIDGLEGFRNANVYPGRTAQFLSAFTNQLRMMDVSTLISEELPIFNAGIEMPNPELANVVEGVILLRYVELHSQIYRLISIMKMREIAYDTSIREFKLSTRGIDVADSFESAEQILTGHPRRRPRGHVQGED